MIVEYAHLFSVLFPTVVFATTPTPLQIDRHLVGCIPPTNTPYGVAVVSNTSQTVAIPTGTNYIIFVAPTGIDFFVQFSNSNSTSISAAPSTTTALPAGTDFDPNLRNVVGYTYATFFSATTCEIIMLCYS